MKHRPGWWALFLVVTASLAALATAQTREPTLRIVSPEDGNVVEGRNVELKMEVRGVELTPRQSSNGAHVLVRLDDSPPVRAYAETFTFQDVSAGNHVVRVELRRTDGSAFRPPVRTQVRFAVRAEER